MAAAVEMYTTKVCPYCIRAKQLLNSLGVNEIVEKRIDLDENTQQEMIERTKLRTVPQIFIDGKHLGGCDDIYELHKQGNLKPLLFP